MNGKVDNKSVPVQSDPGRKLSREVAAQAQRKLKARRNPTPGVWFGMGMMGIVGWSISIPTLSGIALGLWLDKHLTDNHSWTLALMMAGLTLGCFNTWHWVTRERTAIIDETSLSTADEAALGEGTVLSVDKKDLNEQSNDLTNNSDEKNDQ